MKVLNNKQQQTTTIKKLLDFNRYYANQRNNVTTNQKLNPPQTQAYPP